MSRLATPLLCLLLQFLLVGNSADARVASAADPKPGTHERTLESGQKTREYLLHIPRGYQRDQDQPLPLVVMLHGRTSSGKAAASGYYGWKTLADKESFVAVFPTALGSPTSWQGAWRGKPTEDSVFLSELIDRLVEELKIDPDRVYMTGHSSGGFMSYSFATTHSRKLAAIGPVAGLRMGLGDPTAPVSVISFHGMADRIVAYDQEHGRHAAYNQMPSALESAAWFAEHNGCGPPKRTDLNQGRVHVDTWTNQKNRTEVVLYSIEKGGHGWPKRGSNSVAATRLIWDFFKAHPRQSSRPRSK